MAKNNYVLIDYENVQPKNLKLLIGHEISVKVFVGEKLAKVPFDLAAAMQALGNKAEYIQIIGIWSCPLMPGRRYSLS